MQALYETIPALRTRLDRWVVCQYKGARREEDQTVPAPGNAPVIVRSASGTFEQAKNTRETGNFDGIGFVLGEGIFGIDFDHATDARVQEAVSLGS